MILHLNENEFIKTEQPIDISISIHDGENPVLAWYCEPIRLEPVMTDRFVGDVKKGGAVNFRNLFMNPHGNGTHTECVGHISIEDYSINKCLKEFHHMGLLVSVQPEERPDADGKTDRVVSRQILEAAVSSVERDINVLIIRTLPNENDKCSFNYSNTNPTYFDKEAIEFVNELGIDHLVVDQPSIDREEDGGELIGHHVFWNYPDNPQLHKTITELVYIENTVKDGYYIVNIQITSLENDASPSKITLYEIFS